MISQVTESFLEEFFNFLSLQFLVYFWSKDANIINFTFVVDTILFKKSYYLWLLLSIMFINKLSLV
jgi:hypothetical protein